MSLQFLCNPPIKQLNHLPQLQSWLLTDEFRNRNVAILDYRTPLCFQYGHVAARGACVAANIAGIVPDG